MDGAVLQLCLAAIGCCSHKDWSALHRVCRPGTVITTSLWRRLLLPDAHFPAPCPRIWTQRQVQLFKNALCVTFDVISCASDALVWGKLFLFKSLILKNGLVCLVFLCPPSPSPLPSSAEHSGFTASSLPLVKAVPRLLKSLLPGGKEGRDQTAVHQQVGSFGLFIVLCIKACLRPASLSGI